MIKSSREGETSGKPPAREKAVGALILVVGAAVAGSAAQGAGLPAPWLVGPMIVAVVFALARTTGRPEVPRWARRAALGVVGGVLAGVFRPAVLPLIAKEWPAVSLAVGGTLLLSLGAASLLARLARLDRRTAVLGTLPGAASGMLAMSDPLGADPRLVALMQYARVVLVVVSAAVIARFGAPLGGAAGSGAALGAEESLIHGAWAGYGLTALVAAVGVWAGTRLRLPAGALLGPLVLGVALAELGVLRPAWPPGVPPLAYALIGVYAGLLFDRESVRRAGRLLPLMLASTLGLMTACAGLGWALAALTGADPLTAYLATTPGGLDSVAVVAVGSGADASLVLAVQMLRLFAVVLAGALLGRLWAP
ncbi:MAG: AbrB family transcriptional regulator [Actinomycetota bacterium]|nr:AbrB family transcriptional regulator [Actinomycetota bacterium]